jgi:hypothetical protein
VMISPSAMTPSSVSRSDYSCRSEIVMFDSCSCDRFGLEIGRRW